MAHGATVVWPTGCHGKRWRLPTLQRRSRWDSPSNRSCRCC